MKDLSENRTPICPRCSKFTGLSGSWYSPKKILFPVYCIKRRNKKTGDEFYGCVNFPKCKYSYNEPLRRYISLFSEDEMSCNDFQG